jgi:dienelactone hydrolase
MGLAQRMLPNAVFVSAVALITSLLMMLAIRAGQPPTLPAQAGQAATAGEADRGKEIEKLKDHIRFLEIHYTFGPPAELQTEDYAQARSRFRTKLITKGPVPQRWSPVKAPAGVTEIEYPSGDLRLKAWVNRPEDPTRKHPVVLYLHGGFAFGTADWDQSKPYRDAGFVVLTPMLRGENGQPGAFSYYYDELDDVLAAAEYLAKQPYADASRLFVAGHSVGGNLTLLAAMATQRFRAAAAISSAPNQAIVIKREAQKNQTWIYPFDKSDAREILMRSATDYAGSLKCPTRVYYGTAEIELHLMSQRIAALARDRGLDVDALQIEGNHMTCVPEAINQSIAFFKKNSPR